MTLQQRIRRDIEATGPIRSRCSCSSPSTTPTAGSSLRESFARSGWRLSDLAEVSALFGETLARFVEQERERIGQPFEVVEVAAGSGSLVGSLKRSIDVETWAVEASPAAREALGALLGPDRVSSELPDRIRGVVIANELIDNLPMALAQRVEGGWRERWVGVDGEGLAMVDTAARSEVIEWLAAYAGEVPDGGWVEVQLAAGAWLRDVLHRLEAGSVVIFDYGDTSENLIPRRQDGTLRTYRAHHLARTRSTSRGRPISPPMSTSPPWSHLPRRRVRRASSTDRTIS